jgi:hypothetical protein
VVNDPGAGYVNQPVISISADNPSIVVGGATTIRGSYSADTVHNDSLQSASIDMPAGTSMTGSGAAGSKTYGFSPTSPGSYTFCAVAKTHYFPILKTYATTSVTVAKASPAVNFPAPSGTVGQGITLGASVTGGYSPSGGVTYSLVAGSGSIAGNVFTPTAAGSAVIQASYAGDGNNNSASANATVTIAKASPGVNFPAASTTVGVAVTLGASVTGGYGPSGGVTYSLVAGSGSIAGNVFTPSAAGSATIKASYAGDGNNNSASANATVTIAKAAPSVSFPNVGSINVSTSASLNASIAGGYNPAGGISYSIVGATGGAAGSLSGNSLSVTKPGTLTINAAYAGDSNNVAASAQITVTVNEVWNAFDELVTDWYAVSSWTPDPATVPQGQSFTQTRTEQQDRRKGERAVSNSAERNVVPYSVQRTASQIAIGTKIMTATLSTSVAGGAGGAVSGGGTYKIGTYATVIPIPAADSYFVGYAGDLNGDAGASDLNPTPSASILMNTDHSVIVVFAHKSAQMITLPIVGDRYVNAGPFSVAATASSGLPVTLVIASGPATISGNTVQITGDVGTVVIQATQSGNRLFLAAPVATVSFQVLPLQVGVKYTPTNSSNTGIQKSGSGDNSHVGSVVTGSGN